MPLFNYLKFLFNSNAGFYLALNIFIIKFGRKEKKVYLCSQIYIPEIGLYNMTKRIRRIILGLTMIFAIASVWPLAAQTERADSLSQQQSPSAVSEVRGRMMTSPLPVSIRQQGRQICVQSRYNQLLPVYTESGTFYTAFRLSKGTNWLTGLPKGSYLINNRKFTIY